MLKQLLLTLTGVTLITTFVDVNSVQGMNLISNGSFELGQDPGPNFTPLSIGATNITDWTVIEPVDYIGGTWVASDGNRSVDLSELSAGRIEQTFNTIVGENYTVTFDLAGNPIGGPIVKSMTVLAAGDSANFTFDTTGRSTSNMGWETNTWMFTATGSTTTLSFISNTNTNAGPALDNVSVSETVVTDVNEPQTLMMLGTAILIALGTRFKKRFDNYQICSDN